MTEQLAIDEKQLDTAVLTVSRNDIRQISSVMVEGNAHHLGEQRDFRRNDLLANFLPETGRLSVAWVRLADGEQLDVHQHPIKSMIIVCKGSVRLLGDREQELTEGDTVAVPPGARHGFVTRPGEEFCGLSVQFEGGGLYENERVPRVKFGGAPAPLAELEEYNAERLRKFSEHPFFDLFDGGHVGRDREMRDRFVSALYVWSVYFQRMLYARQATCADPMLREVYAGHLREEFGHDRLLKERHGVSDTVYDPILEAVGNWFVMQMHGTDEASKIVIVHMAVETCCQVFGERTGVAFTEEDTASTSYFDLHSEVDEDHRELGRDYLRGLSAAQFPQLMQVCTQAWDQIDLLFDRISAHMVR
ncbi:cupin domain-containing protein [Streptomyces prunicolor]|uniref:cupin domain-containing protein n=1 Tax=Streptomyces prunicolor TaxID=67348 RepID=UPI00386B0DAA|nr:cupin domain-containing protein [Streptomyces prunicolor]